MDITSIRSLTSDYYSVMQMVGMAAIALLIVAVLSSILVKRRNPENIRGIKAVRVTGTLLTVGAFIAAAIIGVVDENVSIEMKERSFSAALKNTYGESVVPGSDFLSIASEVSSGDGKAAPMDFVVDGKLIPVSVKEIAGKWLLFDAAGNELPRVSKA
jgi:UDP-N-acetylmuramyl pentapeptide phosphotransferase/UDP-N-acetylglucosamine-1-phosphate transferase